MNSSPRPLLGVEVLRFACTPPILLWHYQHFYTDGSFETAKQPLFGLLRPLYLYGYLAVWVFWCLSGFVFYWKYATPISAKAVGFGRFVSLRFSRLYPLHLVTLLVVALLAWRFEQVVDKPFVYHLQDTKHFVMQLFMASNWTSNDASFNGPGWSVSVEVIVYVMFFVLCRLGAIRWWSLVPLVVGANYLYRHHVVVNVVDFCFLMFYLGALVGCFHQMLQRRTADRRHLMLAGALAILAYGTVSVAVGALSPSQYVEYMTPILVLMLVLAVHPRSARVGRVLEGLGNLTYSSYLWHFPIQLVVVLVFAHNPAAIPKHSVLFLIGYLVVTYMAAALSYRFIERPAQLWLRRHMGRRSHHVVPVPVAVDQNQPQPQMTSQRRLA